ncbi:MAG: class II fructose-bisphosphate aldolase [Candidatus Pacebacteria bacterium]|nr:class II fructose-bisphosphate aldolase [Candidatus Paceibacterota bacterium]MBP9866885.1 class II fructose-bisphosphate aldolase [Candidatus Paceibacterota bacterium]
MKSLIQQGDIYLETITQYKKAGHAIAHFNISNLDQVRAIVDVAEELKQPVIIGVSEGEREYIGVDMVRKIIDELNQEYSVPIFLNADHTYSLDKVKEVVEAGYDSVIVDGAKLPYEENVALVKECVDYVRGYEIKNKKRVLVEAELGYIGQSSSLNASLPEGVSEENLTTPEQAKDFVLRTGIDMFAPAIGNVHGMLVDAVEPALHIDRLKDISLAVDVPLVLHGASGNTDEDLIGSIDNGIAIIHINTEIRKAFRDGEKAYIDEHPNEVAPYKFGHEGQEEMKKVVRAKMMLYMK